MIAPAIVVSLADKPAIMSVGAWRKAIKAGMYRTARFWHRQLLKKHFTINGRMEYKYAPRSVGYRRQKFNKQQHANPLEYTGDTKRKALSIEDIRATSRSGTVVLRDLPWYIRFSENIDRLPDMVKEITTISDKDRELLGRVMQKEITRGAN